MNASYVRPGWFVLLAIVVFSLYAPAQDRPRVFMAGHGTTNGMTNGSAFGTPSGSGWWAAGRTDSIVDSHDESMELAKNFASNCRGAQVTVNPDAADYVTSLNRESKAKKGLFSKNDQIQVSNKAGDVLLSSTVRSVATAAKDACNLILSDFAAHRHATPTAAANASGMPLGTAKSQPGAPVQSPLVMQNDTELNISSTPPNADIEIDGSFIGNTPSSFGLGSGEHTVKIIKSGYKPWERKVKTSTGAARLVAELETMPAGYVPAPATTPRTVEPDRTTPLLVNAKVSAVPVPTEMTQLATPEPPPSSITPRDNAEEGSIGAWSNEKARIRRDGVIMSSISPAGPADQVGVQQGDFVLAIDDHYVFTVEELSALIRLYKAGQKVRIRYRHDAMIYDTDLIMGRAK